MNNVSYLSLNAFFRSRFGQRVQKIPLDAGLGCPNRSDGSGGCIYCNARGSGTGMAARGISVRQQLHQGILWAKKRYKAKKFAAYFQSFSNTYATLSRLRQIYSEVADHPDVVAVAIGTRPDCVNKDILDLILDCFPQKMVWMEYGLQSASNDTLRRIRRGHDVESFIRAVEITRRYPFLICAHVIFGLPGEGEGEMMETVKLVRDLGIDGIKFHELYVIKDTVLGRMYLEGDYTPILQDTYARLVAKAIRLLPDSTVIQRLTGDPARGELLAPEWAANKQEIISKIHTFLDEV